MLLLRAATASRMRDEEFSRQQEIAATLTDDDTSDRTAVARGATLLHHAWGNANEARTKLRYALCETRGSRGNQEMLWGGRRGDGTIVAGK
jgi:hypothetical protein